MSLTETKSQLISGSEIDRTLVRLAHEIVEKAANTEKLAVIGIHRRGAVLGERLAAKMKSVAEHPVPVGTLGIALYREDLSTIGADPVVRGSDIPFPIDDKDVILVDDVLYTGRTTLSALGSLYEHGRPASVQLCVLIDRGHRTLPIEARFVGKFVETTAREVIEVKVEPIDGEERVVVAEKVDST